MAELTHSESVRHEEGDFSRIFYCMLWFAIQLKNIYLLISVFRYYAFFLGGSAAFTFTLMALLFLICTCCVSLNRQNKLFALPYEGAFCSPKGIRHTQLRFFELKSKSLKTQKSLWALT